MLCLIEFNKTKSNSRKTGVTFWDKPLLETKLEYNINQANHIGKSLFVIYYVCNSICILM